jgi:hypothetical protein
MRSIFFAYDVFVRDMPPQADLSSPARDGTIANTASVRGNEPDPDRANNTATETTTVLPR